MVTRLREGLEVPAVQADGPAAGSAMGLPMGLAMIPAHEGAGASTLVRLLDPQDTGWVIRWRPGMTASQWRRALPAGGDRVPVLVARSTAQGMCQAARRLAGWRRDWWRPALAVVADAPFRPPRLANYRRRAMSSQVITVIDVPYLFALRAVDDPVQVLSQRQAATAVQRLQRQLRWLCESNLGDPGGR